MGLNFAQRIKVRRDVIDGLREQGAGPFEARAMFRKVEDAKPAELAAVSGFDEGDCVDGIYGDAFLTVAMTSIAKQTGMAVPAAVVGGPILDKLIWLFTTDEGLAMLKKIVELFMTFALLF